MGKKLILMAFALIFIFGWFCSSAYSNVISQIEISNSGANLESTGTDSTFMQKVFFNNKERISPSDWVSQDEIHVYENKVVIDIENPQWATFTDTNSMDPVIDADSHAIEVIPKSPEDIKEGDIISYESANFDGAVIHRVIEIGNDKEGWYCRTKGDNNPFEDPGKIRFEQVKRVLVAIIY